MFLHNSKSIGWVEVKSIVRSSCFMVDLSKKSLAKLEEVNILTLVLLPPCLSALVFVSSRHTLYLGVLCSALCIYYGQIYHGVCILPHSRER